MARWMAPRVFSVAQVAFRGDMLRAMAQLRTKMTRPQPELCMDFSQTVKLFVEGTLIFMAEFRRLFKHMKGAAKITCILPENDKVCQVLQQIGFLDLIGVKAQIVPKDADVVNWKFASGALVDGSKYEDVLSEYEGEVAPILLEELFKGITEAMTNVSNHAYDVKRKDGLGIVDQKEWWMFSSHVDDVVMIAFCDLGAGIPGTLKLKHPTLWQKIMNSGSQNDSKVLRYAVKDSISRTGQSNRGLGLGQIVRVLSGVEGGQVAILSNKGGYQVTTGSNPRPLQFRDSIMGTLIYWRFPLQSKELS